MHHPLRTILVREARALYLAWALQILTTKFPLEFPKHCVCRTMNE